MQIIIYTDDNKYSMHVREYQLIWEFEGKKIEEAFRKTLGLGFKEDTIKLLINNGKNGSNSSGSSESDIMHFRYNNRCKIGTFLHELSHRIIMEYNLLEIARERLEITDIHELINLFLYDVISLLYGDNSAKLRVDYESNFEDKVYKESWDKTMALTFAERQNKIKKVLEGLKNETK